MLELAYPLLINFLGGFALNQNTWTLLAREAEGPLGPPAGQAVGPDLL